MEEKNAEQQAAGKGKVKKTKASSKRFLVTLGKDNTMVGVIAGKTIKELRKAALEQPAGQYGIITMLEKFEVKSKQVTTIEPITAVK